MLLPARGGLRRARHGQAHLLAVDGGGDTHRYNFKLYALPTAQLEVPEGAGTAVTGFLVNANALGDAILQDIYDH